MKTNHDLESRVRLAVRDALDRETGPDPVWTDSPAVQRVEQEPRRRMRWPLRVLAVAAVIGAVGGAALLAGGKDEPAAYANGWVAYTVAQEDPAGDGPDIDIWFSALGQEPRRVVGTDTDSVDQVCPAFSPDGRSLAYGSLEGIWSAGVAAVWAHRNGAIVIADVADDGSVTERLTIDVGDELGPACAVWSPASDQLAFGVPLTSPVYPTQSGEGSEVWILRPADGQITVIPDLLATDLEWSPDGSVLAIVGGVETASGAGVIDGLQDSRIHLYEPSSGTMRTFEDTLGVSGLTWSPDGGRIAYAGDPRLTEETTLRTLLVIDVDTGQQEILTDPYRALHGIGPVWSPDGETIVYQRGITGSAERHEVVLVTPADRSAQTGLANEIVMPTEATTADGSSLELQPWRVTWSPDGEYLLNVAWGTVVVAVPTDPKAPAVILADTGEIGAYDFAEGATRVPIQVWQQRPLDAASPSPTTNPSSSAGASPSPSSGSSQPLDPNDTSAWLPFDSERYGLSLAYLPVWTANHGDGEWTFPEDTAWPDGVERTDWFEFDAPEGSVAASAWSVALEPGTTADQWWLDYCTVEVTPCDGTESTVDATLDGHAGWLVDASDPAAYFGIGDRIYLLTVWQPDDFAAMERYGGGLSFIETWLSTMRLLSD